VILAATLYVVVGHGVTIGFHRLLTHRSFAATRPVKIALSILGSMAFEGPDRVGGRSSPAPCAVRSTG
jgi:stearoyl-CoA desaturase (delta-9 desaturase)